MTADSVALFDRALTLHKEGHLADALPLYREALERGPLFPDLLIGAGVAFIMNRQTTDAEACFRRATELAPDNAVAYNHLGTVLNDLGRTREAIAALERSVELDPDEVSSLTNLGCGYRSLGRIDDALVSFQRAAQLDPTIPEIHSNLGTTLATLDLPSEAGLRLYVALILSPGYADAYSNLGAVMLRGSLPHSEPAMQVLQRAVQIDPDLPTAHSNLSVILAGRGDPDIAVPHNLRAAELVPNPEHWSRVLFNLNYCDSWSAEACAREHRRIGALFDAAGEPRRLPPVEPSRGTRHRVGFVSPDFRNHSVSYFLRPLLSAFDRGRFEIFCYSDVLKGDEVTAEIRASADHWTNAIGLTDYELAQKIRADRIDTLIDLAGHTPSNRMGTFALRPAPVQMTWLGYANTSGLSTIDYRIVDEITDPPGIADELASETLLRLPDGFLCYGPPAHAPAPAVRPPAVDGAVVFGTFNNPTKITDATFTLWSRLLLRLPKARLLIKSFRLRDEVLRNRIVGKFADHGVAPERLILLDANADATEHLATYGQIDIGLDPVLYNGTTTTFEALWMGVPVIAERGDRHAGRVGASLLTYTGLTDLIAESDDDYIAIAAHLAEDPTALARVRQGLRERVAASPLCDAAAFARKFERALLEASGTSSYDQTIESLTALYDRRPLPLGDIRRLRAKLAADLLADGAQMPNVEALIPICRNLTLLGLRASPSAPEEAALIERAQARLTGRGSAAWPALLAHCLLAPAHDLPALPDALDLPTRPFVLLAALLVEEPVFWTGPGEAERFAGHAEAVLRWSRQGLAGRGREAAEGALIVASACRLGAAAATDLPLLGLAREHAGLIEDWLAGQDAALDHAFPPSDRTRPRIGIFRVAWDADGEAAQTLSYLQALRGEGEIVLLAVKAPGETPFELKIRALADRVVTVPDSVPAAAAALRAEDLDLLLFAHDLSTHLSLPAALAAFRLARLQAVTAASPFTTGFARIDAYLADSSGMDPSSFAETLVVPEGTPALLDWIPEGPPPVRVTRDELGIPGDRVLMASGVPLGRLTAELLSSWGAILQRCPDAHLLLYPLDSGWTGHPALADAERRLRALLADGGANQGRVTILPPGVSKAGARAVLAIADLYLDGFPASDPADLLDPLSVDLPMLLYAGHEPRTRRAAQLHRAFDLPALVAGSAEDYVSKALALATAKDDRVSLRRKTAASRQRLAGGSALISWRSFQSRVATSGRERIRDR